MQQQKRSFEFESVVLSPDEQIGLHRQDTWELSYIIAGSGIRQIGDKSESFKSGEVVMIPPDIPHCWYFERGVSGIDGKIANITITFDNKFLDNCQTAFPELHESISSLKRQRNAVKFNGSQADAIISILKSMRDKNSAERIAPMISLLLVISSDDNRRVVGKYQKKDKVQKQLKQIQIYVICNARKNITLDDAARHIGMNRASFCVFFKKVTGKTFITYLNEYRISLACRLFRRGETVISEVCFHVGFNNIPYFNRVFKRVKGMSPSQYIALSAGKTNKACL
ncbi:MAG: AraC family transcriptional regulator [Prevotellaceae bacterium]|nr:AraC family transcriptional regulator [Prevotellaceae bacterium]